MSARRNQVERIKTASIDYTETDTLGCESTEHDKTGSELHRVSGPGVQDRHDTA